MDKMVDKPIMTVILGVIGVGVGAIEVLHDLLSLIALAVPTLYTLWRWRRDTQKNHPPNKFQEKG